MASDNHIDITQGTDKLRLEKHFAVAIPAHCMKSACTIISKSAALAVCLVALTLSASAQNAKPNDAVITAVSGSVKVSKNGGAFVPAPVGSVIQKGDVVKTGAGSHADIELGKNVGVMQLTPNTTLGITDMSFSETALEQVTDTQLDLSTGAIYAHVNKLSKASRYEIKTPRGIAGIRGTSFYLTSGGDLAVAEGTAGIAYTDNGTVKTHIVRSGQRVSPGDGAPSAAPGQLLKDIIQALRDAGAHGIGRLIQPFVPPNEIYVTPVLPSGR
jgi:hypothetical protein